jgi:hypothetical protein
MYLVVSYYRYLLLTIYCILQSTTMPLGVEGLGEKRPSIASRALRLKIARLEAELSLTRLQLEEFELNHEVHHQEALLEDNRHTGNGSKDRIKAGWNETKKANNYNRQTVNVFKEMDISELLRRTRPFSDSSWGPGDSATGSRQSARNNWGEGAGKWGGDKSNRDASAAWSGPSTSQSNSFGLDRTNPSSSQSFSKLGNPNAQQGFTWNDVSTPGWGNDSRSTGLPWDTANPCPWDSSINNAARNNGRSWGNSSASSDWGTSTGRGATTGW